MEKDNLKTKSKLMIGLFSFLGVLMVGTLVATNFTQKGTYSALNYTCPDGGTVSGSTCVASCSQNATVGDGCAGLKAKGFTCTFVNGNSQGGTYSCTKAAVPLPTATNTPTPTSCGIGKYLSVDGTCKTCSAGFYCIGNQAHLCSPGKYCPNAGMSVALVCPANHYCGSGATAPTACPSGTTSPAGSIDSSACVASQSSGSTSTPTPTTSCTYLSEGHCKTATGKTCIYVNGCYVPQTSTPTPTTSCTYLSEGHCKTATGKTCIYVNGCYVPQTSTPTPTTSCTYLSEGHCKTATGKTCIYVNGCYVPQTTTPTRTPCGAGKGADSSATTGCSNCAAGYYSPANDDVCHQCPSGQTSNAGAASCTQCTYLSEGHCKTATGKTCIYVNGCYVPQTSTPTRTPCGAGKGADSSATTGCSNCAAGYYSPANDDVCHQCPSGQTSNAGAASCTQCTYLSEGNCKTATGKTCMYVNGCWIQPCPTGYALSGTICVASDKNLNANQCYDPNLDVYYNKDSSGNCKTVTPTSGGGTNGGGTNGGGTNGGGTNGGGTNGGGTNGGGTVSNKPVKIYYNANGGSLKGTSETNYFTNNSGWAVYDSDANSKEYIIQTCDVGATCNLWDYNGDKWLFSRSGYIAKDGAEWSAKKANGSYTSLNQATDYTHSQLVNVANKEQTDYYEVWLYVNWIATDNNSAGNRTCYSCISGSKTQYVWATSSSNAISAASSLSGNVSCALTDELNCQSQTTVTNCYECNGSIKHVMANSEADARAMSGGDTCTIVTTNKCNASDNPKTGTFGIIVAWIIGIATIGYSVWYFKKSTSIK